jgi:hypothetical protein
MRLLCVCILVHTLVTFGTALDSTNSSSYPYHDGRIRNKIPFPTKKHGSTAYVSEKRRRLAKLLEQRHFVDTSSPKKEGRGRPRHLGSSHHRRRHHPKLENFMNHWEESARHEEEGNIRFAASSFVNYNGTHPYEIMKRRRRLEKMQDFEFAVGGDHQKRRDQVVSYPRPPWQEGAEYKPIRITFDTWFLDQEQLRYGAEIIFVKEKVLPKVKSFWEAGEDVRVILFSFYMVYAKHIRIQFSSIKGVSSSI